MVGGPPTARIPPLTSAIMRALTGIDLQNDGPTIGRRCPPNFAGDKQMGSENRAFEPIRSSTCLPWFGAGKAADGRLSLPPAHSPGARPFPSPSGSLLGTHLVPTD
ncbi:unnamed protein product [Rangifer tarandus platyrhynchus]|uniref:Uncharacterized protein n=1 Tax=Rangifer tarandus platyrhynchus TaxID=3082113 RepID=A0AC59Z8V6_RANTA